VPDDRPAVVTYSNGQGGLPTGVIYTHRTLRRESEEAASDTVPGAGMRYVMTPTPSLHADLTRMVGTIHGGGTVVL
jgi:hypothetical protein